MDNNELTQFYDQLKNKLDQSTTQPAIQTFKVAAIHGPQGSDMYKRKCIDQCNSFKDACYKHLLVDVYCKILPFDKDYIDNHQGMMKCDIENMLKNKGMTATQYLTSAYESTKAPLLEFMIRSGKMLANQYFNEALETLKEAQEKDLSIPAPEADTSDANVRSQLVDVQNDQEYSSFVDALKEKTKDQIVDGIAKVIIEKDNKDELSFKPKTQNTTTTESTVAVAMDYIQKKFLNESEDIDSEMKETMLGMAIREATLNQFDLVFNRPEGQFKEYVNAIQYGKGVIINEAAINDLKK